MTLVIQASDGSEVLRADIGEREPMRVTVAVLNAIDAIPKPRKVRRDAGKARTAATQP